MTENAGTIPSSFGFVTDLTYLDLSGNNLFGKLPPTIGSLTLLTFFGVASNKLTGPLPPEIGSLSRVTRLDIQENSFQGTVPFAITLIRDMVVLNMQNNSFLGAIPNALCDYPALNYSSISFQDNLFLTCYPDCLTNATLLNDGGLRRGCPGDQDTGLCGMVAATNIGQIFNMSMWECDSNNAAIIDPCGTPPWNGLICEGIDAKSLDWRELGVTGETYLFSTFF